MPEPKFQQSQDDRYLMAREIVLARDVVPRALDMLTKLAQRGKLQPPLPRLSTPSPATRRSCCRHEHDHADHLARAERRQKGVAFKADAPTLAELEAVIRPLLDGADMEHVAVLWDGRRCDMFVDEMGALKKLKRNDYARDLSQQLADPSPGTDPESMPAIYGTAILFADIVLAMTESVPVAADARLLSDATREGRPFVPVYVWFGEPIIDGEVQGPQPALVLRDRRQHRPVDLRERRASLPRANRHRERWPFCARWPITEREFEFLKGRSRWAAEHAPAHPAASRANGWTCRA